MFLTQVGGAPANYIWILIAIVTGIVACATWRRLIRSYGELDAGRFQVIHLLESRLEQFVETFHDDGQTDLLECLRAYREIGYDGVLRPDHVPTLEGDSHENPAYSTLGRLFALGYVKGLCEAAYAD